MTGHGWSSPSPGTGTVIPYFAVVDCLVAPGVPSMDVGTIHDQDFHYVHQTLAGCQMQGC